MLTVLSNFVGINMGKVRHRGRRMRSLPTDRPRKVAKELFIFINALERTRA